MPTDLDELRLFAAGLQAELARKEIEIAANAAKIHAKALHIEKLKAQLAVLRRARFGRSSEKLDRDIEQLELLIGDLEEDAAGAEAKQSHAPGAPKTPAQSSRHPVRRPLPEHLPRPGCAASMVPPQLAQCRHASKRRPLPRASSGDLS
jgi:transposase